MVISKVHWLARRLIIFVTCFALVLQSMPLPATAQGFGLPGMGGGSNDKESGGGFGGLIPLPKTGGERAPSKLESQFSQNSEPRETPFGMSQGELSNVFANVVAAISENTASELRELPEHNWISNHDIPYDVAEARKLADWIRDHTKLVPYVGRLKSENGVLSDLEANALDRAMLLATSLEANGAKVRLARGTKNSALRRVHQWSVYYLGNPDVEPPEFPILTSGAQDLSQMLQSPTVLEANKRLEQLPSDTPANLADRLLDAAGSVHEVDIDETLAKNSLTALRDYWTVLIEDPSSRTGYTEIIIDEHLISASDIRPIQTYTIAQIKVDADLNRDVKISVQFTVTEGGEEKQVTVFNHTLAVETLLKRDIELKILPYGLSNEILAELVSGNPTAVIEAMKKAWGFVPALFAGQEVFFDRGLDLHGEVRSRNGIVYFESGMAGMGGAVGILGAALERTTNPQPFQVVAGHISFIQSADPFRPKQREEIVRTIFDLRAPDYFENASHINASEAVAALSASGGSAVKYRILGLFDRFAIRFDTHRVTPDNAARKMVVLFFTSCENSQARA